MNPTRNTAKKTFLIKQIIGLELRFIRTQQKLNMSEAAAQSGISIKKIKSIESGKHFSLYHIAVLSAIYGFEPHIELKRIK